MRVVLGQEEVEEVQENEVEDEVLVVDESAVPSRPLHLTSSKWKKFRSSNLQS